MRFSLFRKSAQVDNTIQTVARELADDVRAGLQQCEQLAARPRARFRRLAVC